MGILTHKVYLKKNLVFKPKKFIIKSKKKLVF